MLSSGSFRTHLRVLVSCSTEYLLAAPTILALRSACYPQLGPSDAAIQSARGSYGEDSFQGYAPT